MSLSIMDDEAFLLYLIITNVIEYNGWWSIPTLLNYNQCHWV
jgi:hypothetical protein